MFHFQLLKTFKKFRIPNLCRLKNNTSETTLTYVLRFSVSVLAKMKKYTVLVANDSIPEIALVLLNEACNVKIVEVNRQKILKEVKGVDALFWSSHEKLDKEILDAGGPTLRVIGTMSAGYDQFDVAEIKKRNIKFGNTPGVLSDAVAELAVLLMLATSRRIIEGRNTIEKSTWGPNINNTQHLLGKDIAGSTVGIVGMGHIGQEIVKRLKCFNVGKFLYSGHREKAEAKALGAEFVTQDTLIRTSDYVIAAAPLTEETRGMFNDDLFSKMKTSSIFINIARGALVDQPALIRALKENKIFAAGLDVMIPEPLPSDHELLKLPNCVITPHIGSATLKTRNKMAELAANNILKALNGEPMIAPVV